MLPGERRLGRALWLAVRKRGGLESTNDCTAEELGKEDRVGAAGAEICGRGIVRQIGLPRLVDRAGSPRWRGRPRAWSQSGRG